MSYYREGVDWRIVGAAVAVVAVLAFAFLFTRCDNISIRWDSNEAERGRFVTLWVEIRNCAEKTADEVVVKVRPISPFLRVYDWENVEREEIVLPKLASGAGALARFGIFVESGAYAGDHAVEITVEGLGDVEVFESKIRVV